MVLNASDDGDGDDDADQILYARMLRLHHHRRRQEEGVMKRTNESLSDHLGVQEHTIQNRAVNVVGSKAPSLVVGVDAGDGVGGIAEDIPTPQRTRIHAFLATTRGRKVLMSGALQNSMAMAANPPWRDGEVL